MSMIPNVGGQPVANAFEPWLEGPRIKAIVGHYGSGKTEIALSMALNARAAGRETAVVDMDIVNPFFRSAEQGELLRAAGVQMIAPPYALTGVDLPVLSADILQIFARDGLFSVLDVGGDDAGAAALGRFRREFDAHPADLYYVVNCFRPFSATAEQVIELMDRIAARARIAPTGLINNANLGRLTEPEHLMSGQALLSEVSARTGVPIACACALPEVLSQLSPGSLSVPVLPVNRLLMPDWLED